MNFHLFATLEQGDVAPSTGTDGGGIEMKISMSSKSTGYTAIAILLALSVSAAYAGPPPTPKTNAAGINSIIDSGDSYAVSHSGFWKFRSPKITKPFGNEDALDLAEGKHVNSNGCKVLWIADGGNMLCFITLAHRETFLRAPESYTKHAIAFNQKSQ